MLIAILWKVIKNGTEKKRRPKKKHENVLRLFVRQVYFTDFFGRDGDTVLIAIAQFFYLSDKVNFTWNLWDCKAIQL